MCLPIFIQCPNRMLQLYLRIKNKIEADEEQWEFKLAGGEMSIYIGVDMAKDKFDYCAIDRDLNILCRKVDSGMPKKKALIAASRKQCHIIWSVWHNNKPFEVPENFKK